jgi:DNA (cytosine-5)-methyltransferase 1
MDFGSVCSGIEAASVAWHGLGWRAAWLSEIEAFPSALLAHRYPDVPNLGDMTKIARAVLIGEVKAPGVLVGGTPCQAFSVAGLREGLSDARGQLTMSYVRLLDAIDYVRGRAGERPAVAVWENVPGVLSSKDNAFGCFLGALAGEDVELQPPGKKWANAGCVFGPSRTVAWRVLDAQYFGVAQRRRRVFVVASARKDFNPVDVLFEFDGVRRDSAPSREAGKDAPAGTLRSTDGGCDVDHAIAGHLQAFGGGNTRGSIDVGTCLTTSGQRLDFDTETFVAQDYKSGMFSRTDCASALTTSEDRSRAAPLAVCVTGDITHTLKAEGFDASEDGTGRGQPIVAADTYSICLGSDPINARELAQPITRRNGDPGTIASGAAVRRLMPVECERLQAFPDGYTQVPSRGKPAADGPRYKALGNSMCVNVMRWIGERIEQASRKNLS